MRKTKFYICPVCGNLLFSMEEAEVSCCRRTLSPTEPKKASEEEKLRVEKIENDYFLSTAHPMSKEHYITFVALLSGDSILLRKQYPEWDLQVRFPRRGHGMLLWFDTKEGLMYQLL